MVSYKLNINSKGFATCANCKREYDLNNNGICKTGGKKLIKYRATSTGALGVLSINN